MNSLIKDWTGQIYDAAETGRKLNVRGGGSKNFYGLRSRAMCLM